MRIVHVSTTDSVGGAARGAIVLHQALVELGVDSLMLSEHAHLDDPRVLGDARSGARLMHAVRHRLDQLPVKAHRSRNHAIFSPNLLPSGVVARVRSMRPDIVHLHWVGASFVRPEDVARFDVPIVWTLRDMWPFTGGCHYSGDCHRFEDSCGRCPHLASGRDRDLSRWSWGRKSKSWIDVDITPVGISSWMSERAAASSLFRNRPVVTIDNAIDTNYWTPGGVVDARSALGIRREARVLAFVALDLADTRKGFSHFLEVCRALSASPDAHRYQALAVGRVPADGIPHTGIDTVVTGSLDDAMLRLAYRASDVTVLPSTHEAFGKTAAESLACGTPCVVFENTGMACVVEDGSTGSVVEHGDVGALLKGVRSIIDHAEHRRALGEEARRTAQRRFSVKTQAARYVDLYHAILAKQR